MSARRLTVCAAFALVPITMCASSAWGVYVKDLREPSDIESGMHERLSYSPEAGGMVLHRAIHCIPFVWVPSPDTGIVSKLDARTGREIARYRIGPDGGGWSPTAIAPDSDGNVYVACRSYGGTGKVVRIAAAGGTDRNGDGVIATCGDGDCNGRITPSETLVWTTDERVGEPIEVGPEGSTPASVAFDSSGCLWVALWGERSVVKVNPVTRAVVASVALVGRPSALVADQRGSLWVLSRDSKTLCRVSTVTNTLVEFHSMRDCAPCSMCIDPSGRIWIANSMGGLVGFQTATGVWSTHQADDLAGFSCVVSDADGDVWAACPAGNRIAHFSGEDGSFLGYVPTGVRPSSICFDEDGYLWSLDEGGSTATKIDTQLGAPVAGVNVCESPFSSSPFASFLTRPGIASDGVWRLVLDTKTAGAGWGIVTWDCATNGGRVDVKARTAETPECLASVPFQTLISGRQFASPDGRFIEIVVTLTSHNGASPVLYGLRVEGVNRAPDVRTAAPSIDRILKADHGMEPIEIVGIRDPEGDKVRVTITAVTQDEPTWGLSEEDKWPDATGVGTSTVCLRGEMDPGAATAPGNGRVYTITFRAVDSLGAASTGKVKVTVPVGILPTDTATDDGQKYDSTCTRPESVQSCGEHVMPNPVQHLFAGAGRP